MAEVEVGDYFADDAPAPVEAPRSPRPYTGLVEDDRHDDDLAFGDEDDPEERRAAQAIRENRDVDAESHSEAEEANDGDGKQKKKGGKKKKADESGDEEGKEESAKKKKKSLRPKNITLDVERLLESPYGLSKLKSMMDAVKFKEQKGAESHNIRLLMQVYEVWMDGLLPRESLDTVVDRLEKIGHKGAVKQWLTSQRVDYAATLQQEEDKEYKPSDEWEDAGANNAEPELPQAADDDEPEFVAAPEKDGDENTDQQQQQEDEEEEEPVDSAAALAKLRAAREARFRRDAEVAAEHTSAAAVTAAAEKPASPAVAAEADNGDGGDGEWFDRMLDMEDEMRREMDY